MLARRLKRNAEEETRSQGSCWNVLLPEANVGPCVTSAAPGGSSPTCPLRLRLSHPQQTEKPPGLGDVKVTAMLQDRGPSCQHSGGVAELAGGTP